MDIEKHKPTQNDSELKLLRMILVNVLQIETKNWDSTEHRAFAIGRLEGMITFKELTDKNEEIPQFKGTHEQLDDLTIISDIYKRETTSKSENKDFCERCCKEFNDDEMVTIKCECCGNFESDRICKDCLKYNEDYKK